MAYTIAQWKTDLSSVIHGVNIDKVNAPLDLAFRAARGVLADVDPFETQRIAQIVNSVFDDVYDYTVPADLKGNKVIDIRPQVNRTPADNFSQTYSERFDMYKGQSNNLFQIQTNTNTKSIRLAKDAGTAVLLNEMDSITANGTWVVGGDAENLSVDTLQYVSGSGSLKFDLDGSTTTGYLENSTMDAQDLSDYEDESSLFVWVYLPDASTITNVILRWGASASVYWHRTVTAPHFGAFVNGWNLLAFDWNGATEVGSPTSATAAAIDYLRVTVTYDGVADTDFRLDKIIARKGEIFDLVYYSKYLFRTTAGVFIEAPTLDTDEINLDTHSYNLFLNKSAYYAAQQLQGMDSGFDLNFFKGEYMEDLRRYKKLYPSELEKPRQPYYSMRKGRKGGGRSFLDTTDVGKV